MMAKTKIEWCDYTCNCFWGCENGCSYCQARKIAHRFGESIGRKRAAEAPKIYTPEVIQRMKEFKPVFLPDQLAWLYTIKPPARIFIDFMGDWAGDWNRKEDVELMFSIIKTLPDLTFLLLTKQTQNLPLWSPYPENCWVGGTATNASEFHFNEHWLKEIRATVIFISLEPLLGQINSNVGWFEGTYLQTIFKEGWLNWLIIGQQTPISKKTEPKIEHIQQVVEAADKAGIPVFLKDNLAPLLASHGWDGKPSQALVNAHKSILRQEFPK
jgi:protein gp37